MPARPVNTKVGVFVSPVTVNSVSQGAVPQPNINQPRNRPR